MKTFIICMMMSLGLTIAVEAQFSIKGNIKTSENDQPLIGANIWLEGTNKATVADIDGNFTLTNIKKGEYNLFISFVGYQSFQKKITLDSDQEISVALVRQNILTDEVIVNATRVTDKQPITFTNVKKEEIAKQNLGQDIPYLLNYTPSVVSTSDAGTGIGYTGIRIRGSDATRINVTINGIPYNDAESQGTFWVDLPDFASSVDNIQIQRGVGTSTNGSGAFGATINVQTTTFNEKAYGSIDNSFGSFNTRKHTVMAGSGLIDGKFTFDARLSKIASDGFIDRATADLQSYFLSGGYYGKSTLLKVNVFSGKEITYQSWYGTPESRITGNREEMLAHASRNGLSASQTQNLLNSGRTYNFYQYENEVDDFKQDHYQVILAQDLSPNLTLNTALYYTKGQGFFEQFREDDDLVDYGLDNVVVGNETIESTDLIRRRWLDNDLYGFTYSFDYSPSAKTSLILGGGYSNYTNNHFGEIIWAQFASNAGIRERYYDNDSEKNDFNSFLKIQHQLTDRLNIFGDLQYRRVGYEAKGIDNDLRTLNVDETFNFFNPKFGATYNLSANMDAYASFSIGNREPVRNDFIDSPADRQPEHETLRNVEAGIRKSGKKYSYQVNYYLMDYKNQLVLTGELNDVGSNVRTNAKKSYRTGIEFIGGIKPNEKWELMGNLTLSRNKIRVFDEIIYDYGVAFDEFNVITNNFDDVDISFSPNIIGGASFSYNPMQNLSITLFSKYVGRQFLDNTGNESRQIDDYFINDLRLTYQLRPKFFKSVTFTLLVNNLLDIEYESNGYTFGYLGGGQTIRENFYYPQAGINFLAGLSIKF